jgi:hypothetical protein
MRTRRILSTFLLFAAAGSMGAVCPKKAEGPAFQELVAQGDKAVVYFYRPKQMGRSNNIVLLNLAGVEGGCVEVLNGGYAAFLVAPGELQVETDVKMPKGALTSTKKRPYSFYANPGEALYIKTMPDGEGLASFANLVGVPPEEGKRELPETRLTRGCGQK